MNTNDIKVKINDGYEITVGKYSTYPEFKITLVGGITINYDGKYFIVEDPYIGIIGKAYSDDRCIEILKEVTPLKDTALEKISEIISKKYRDSHSRVILF